MLKGMHRFLLPLVLVVAVGVGGTMAAVASTRSASGTVGSVMTAKNSSYGTVLVSAGGRTLYRFTPDRKGVSRCSGACVALWPPLLVKSAAALKAGSGVNRALLGTTKRSNGALQVTYAGFPLYRFSGDSASSDAKGEGFKDFGGQWFVVDAKGGLVKKAVSSSSGSHSAWG